MEVKGKKVVFLGDSITQGVGVSSVENRYTDVFARATGAVVSNYGISGTRIAKQKVPYFATENAMYERDFLLRVDEDINDDDVSLIVVFGGTNDFGHGDASLGSFYERDEYTFYGAMHLLINKLAERFPEARIVFMTPLHRIGENDPCNHQGMPHAPLKDYVNAIREVCEYYSVPVLDLYKDSGMQPAIEVYKNHYMPDGLHPSDNGALRIASMLVEFVKTL